jgi:ferric-dicitrate binding protein FerR (iron transport regulator)
MTDYLWDRTGPPDGDVARLEGLLARYRHRPRRRPARVVLVAAAAALVAAAVLFYPRGTGTPEARPAWEVTWLEGSGDARLAVGDWLDTGSSRARVRVADIGRVDLDPNTRVQLVASGESEHRIDLRRGKLHAFVYAPPRLFLVDTPAATAVDLGCAYTLEVDPDGGGLLHVESGHVELLGRDGTMSFVPRGASCRIGAGGAGVPWFPGVPEGLLDPGAQGFATALAIARAHDALTLWHLIARVDDERRAHVAERLKALAPPPPEAPLDRILTLDRAALLAWRETLPLP